MFMAYAWMVTPLIAQIQKLNLFLTCRRFIPTTSCMFWLSRDSFGSDLVRLCAGNLIDKDVHKAISEYIEH